MGLLLDRLDNTSEVEIPKGPFEKIIGQENAVALVKTAVMQRRHVLLCGVPGVGKSMLAKAAYSLLPKPTQEIRVVNNPNQPERPITRILNLEDHTSSGNQIEIEREYIRPEKLPFDVAVMMGYRCPRCMTLSSPEFEVCLECNSVKRSDWRTSDSFHGLLHALDVINEPALLTFSRNEERYGKNLQITYSRTSESMILVEYAPFGSDSIPEIIVEDEHVLVSQYSSRFVQISGASPVELLGDVRHDPYGSAKDLGLPAHKRVIPGAIHEAHQGILYIDEIAALGNYQKHLLTAMQDLSYPITAHNPQSSGASVRVDGVPCDFLLFAACNLEDLPNLIPPLRSRIKGYGYEIMLKSWMDKTNRAVDSIVRFIAQTVTEDGRIPHFSIDAIEKIIDYAEKLAVELDGQRDALTLRLRELGGLIRVAGDFAVNDGARFVQRMHVENAFEVYQGVDVASQIGGRYAGTRAASDSYGDYFL